MYLLFVILMVIAALLMCFIVLIQNSKGGGLASGFSSSNAIMGVRKTTDFLEKATWGLAIFMVIMSIATAYVVPHSSAVKDAVLEQAQKEQQTNPYNLPAGTAAPQTDATAPARILSKFAKTAPALEIKGGVVEGTFYDAEGMKAIAAVPSREELLSKLLGSMQSPITNFARVINQIAEQGGAGESVEAAPAEEAPVEEAPAAEEAPAE